MSRVVALALAWLLAVIVLPVHAQTRAWLDRAQVGHGETATLNIQTDQSVSSIDYAPLQRQFDVGGQTVRRSYQRTNGRSTTTSPFAGGIRPRAPGVFSVPALRVGNTTTAPLQLTVVAPSVMPASGDADAFVETVVDAARPYVQQAVGVQVRLHYAVPLMSGQLEQDPPTGASLRQVGEDLTYQRQIDGRRYNVVERRFLLIPERSGVLTLPGARFNGQTMGGFFDQVFDDGRKAVSAASPARRLDVQPIPARAPQPWLPLHDLKLRYAQAPTQARAGEADVVGIEVIPGVAIASPVPPVALAACSCSRIRRRSTSSSSMGGRAASCADASRSCRCRPEPCRWAGRGSNGGMPRRAWRGRRCCRRCSCRSRRARVSRRILRKLLRNSRPMQKQARPLLPVAQSCRDGGLGSCWAVSRYSQRSHCGAGRAHRGRLRRSLMA